MYCLPPHSGSGTYQYYAEAENDRYRRKLRVVLAFDIYCRVPGIRIKCEARAGTGGGSGNELVRKQRSSTLQLRVMPIEGRLTHEIISASIVFEWPSFGHWSAKTESFGGPVEHVGANSPGPQQHGCSNDQFS